MKRTLIVTAALVLNVTALGRARAETAPATVAGSPPVAATPARTFGGDGGIALDFNMQVLRNERDAEPRASYAWKSAGLTGSYFFAGGNSLSLGLSHARFDQDSELSGPRTRRYGLTVGVGRRVSALGPVSFWPRLLVGGFRSDQQDSSIPLQDPDKGVGASLLLGVVAHPFPFLFVEAGPGLTVDYSFGPGVRRYEVATWTKLAVGFWL